MKKDDKVIPPSGVGTQGWNPGTVDSQGQGDRQTLGVRRPVVSNEGWGEEGPGSVSLLEERGIGGGSKEEGEGGRPHAPIKEMICK
jgi:hypothetical protein